MLNLHEYGDTIVLAHNYSIMHDDQIDSWSLFCGGNFVYSNESLDVVLSRYCMQVVDDCGLTSIPIA